ncbi:MAG: 50S ribosomal protein L22 [Acidimicrobiales bacterium]
MAQGFGVKTNERPGTRSVVRYARFSAFKARPVLDLIRSRAVADADEILQFTPRAAAVVIRKCLASAVANAQHNDELDPDELYVSACFADEGPTLRRFRPRARGRATRIRKRTCHVTVIVSRMPEEMLERHRRRQEGMAAAATRGRRGRDAAATRRERVRRSRGQEESPPATEDVDQAPDAAQAPAGAADETGSVAEGRAGEAEGRGAQDDIAEGRTDEAAPSGADDTAEDTEQPEIEDVDQGPDAAQAPAGAADETGSVAEGRAGEAEGRVAQDDTADEATERSEEAEEEE